MKKRFRNILKMTKKKNGTVVLTDDGYGQIDEFGNITVLGSDSQSQSTEWIRLEGDMMYKVTLKEAGNDVWKIFCGFPVEAEEGWGQTLRVMVESFAVDG